MIKFGTGGWRAIIGDEFTKANIQLLSKAMCIRMKQEGNDRQGILIGYDRRFLSKEAMRWCGEVFAQEGITAMLVNKAAPRRSWPVLIRSRFMAWSMRRRSRKD